MKKTYLIPFIFASLLGKAQKNEDAATFAATITGKALHEKLSIVAGPEMEGRETATAGQRKAAAYIEATFKKIGLKPGNGSSYQQYYPVYRDTLRVSSFAINGKPLNWNNDYNFSMRSIGGTNVQYSNIVFAGYGIIDEPANTNDYAGLDVKGKIVVVLEGAPDGYKPVPVPGNRRAGNTATQIAKQYFAQSKGVAGLLIVSKEFPRKKPAPTQGNMYLKAAEANGILLGTISENAAHALLSQSPDLGFKAIVDATKGNYITEIKINIDKKTDTLQSSNVCGLLEGTDKKDEYLVLTGHYDHLGKQDGLIYYGADDDGSGTVSVLQMAEAFVAAKKSGKAPRRSILFMTVSGEEKGLWGSEYYSEHPLFPLDKTTADLNTDMVGRVGEAFKGDTSNYVFIIGDDKLSSDLAPLTDSINKTAKLELDRRYNDINDPNKFYYRSDHYNFAKMGVPIIFYFDGVHADYHKPTDTVDKINFTLMEKRVRFIFNTAWAIANKERMLKRDIPLNIPGR
ncbi:M28 family peptidase [Parasediminibacterium sp. JCM 36343]|uniref:M28 family peptidase n=1 Tax=Parasediminibacterium sp. JCM 36343 TaxID=3374279 RepID=UPI00397A0108